MLAARVPARRAFALAPLGMLPDVDALVGPHRAVAHNLWAAAIVAIVVFAAFRRRVADPARLSALAAFAFASHILLDLPYGVAVLWPLAPKALLVHPAILVDMGGTLPVFLPRLLVEVLPHAPQFGDPPILAPLVPPVHEFVSASAFAIGLVALIALGVQRARFGGVASPGGPRPASVRNR